MPFEIVRNNIADMQVDAIVCAANAYPAVNAGVELAIHKKAGAELLNARKELGVIQCGDGAVTPGFGLPAKHVIHTVTPTWVDGTHGEEALLRGCYDKSLALAVQTGCESVAFPLLSAGNHGFPQAKALQIAISAISGFLLEHDLLIYLVVFGKETVALSEKVVHHVARYIDEHYVEQYEQSYAAANFRTERFHAPFSAKPEEYACAPCIAMPVDDGLEEYLKQKDAGFTERLSELIARSGRKNSEIYKRANISKQCFSKIINNPDAHPSKSTAVALALALELDLEETIDLIGRAGYTLTNGNVFDLIIRYFIERKIFNVIEINLTLYDFDQMLLGSNG